jgi:phage terminase large subunit-like protein
MIAAETLQEFRPPTYASPQRLIDGQLPPTAGPKVCQYMERYLVHGEGDSLGLPVRKTPAQRYVLDRIFEYDPTTMHLIYDRVVILMAKGNSKTEDVAHIGITETSGPVAPLRSPHVVVSAASYDQADNVFRAAHSSIEHGPLADYFELLESVLRPKGDPEFTGYLERIAARAGTADGALPTCSIIDEVHELKSPNQIEMYNRQRKGLLKRSVPRRGGLFGPLLICISTQGSDESELLIRLYEHGRRVASGETDDPSFLFLCWEAEKAADEDLDDPDQLDRALLQANPNAGHFLSMEQLRRAYRDPEADRYDFERFTLNRRVSRPRAWITEAAWKARVDERGLPEAGTEIVVGFKGSYNRNTTALVGWTRDDYGFVIGAWERENRDPNWTVPRGEVDAVLHKAMNQWRVAELVCDPVGWVSEVEAWALEYGSRILKADGDEDIVVEEGTVLAFDVNGKRMQQANDRFRAAIVTPGPGLRHDGDARLARHIANCNAREGRWGTVLEAQDDLRKIDIAQAAIMARQRALYQPAEEERGPVLLGSFRL